MIIDKYFEDAAVDFAKYFPKEHHWKVDKIFAWTNGEPVTIANYPDAEQASITFQISRRG